MIKICEEPWQVSSQRTIRTSKLLMRISPSSFPIRTVRTLFEEFIPSVIPFIECSSKFRSRDMSDGQSDGSELLPCQQLRTLREPLGNRLELVILAVLNGNVRKPFLEHLPNTLPAIDGEGKERVSCSFQGIKALSIMFYFL